MTSKKYSSKIEEQKDSLKVRITYDRVFTKEDEELSRKYFHFRARQRGDQVNPEDIKVSPKAGETTTATTSFTVELNQPLYLGLRKVYQEASYAFPLLIEDLRIYGDEHPEHKKLVSITINKLEKIIEEV
jgi:hypothetical protein